MTKTDKVIVPVPDGYAELPEDERLPIAATLAETIQAGLARDA